MDEVDEQILNLTGLMMECVPLLPYAPSNEFRVQNEQILVSILGQSFESLPSGGTAVAGSVNNSSTATGSANNSSTATQDVATTELIFSKPPAITMQTYIAPAEFRNFNETVSDEATWSQKSEIGRKYFANDVHLDATKFNGTDDRLNAETAASMMLRIKAKVPKMEAPWQMLVDLRTLANEIREPGLQKYIYDWISGLLAGNGLPAIFELDPNNDKFDRSRKPTKVEPLGETRLKAFMDTFSTIGPYARNFFIPGIINNREITIDPVPKVPVELRGLLPESVLSPIRLPIDFPILEDTLSPPSSYFSPASWAEYISNTWKSQDTLGASKVPKSVMERDALYVGSLTPATGERLPVIPPLDRLNNIADPTTVEGVMYGERAWQRTVEGAHSKLSNRMKEVVLDPMGALAKMASFVLPSRASDVKTNSTYTEDPKDISLLRSAYNLALSTITQYSEVREMWPRFYDYAYDSLSSDMALKADTLLLEMQRKFNDFQISYGKSAADLLSDVRIDIAKFGNETETAIAHFAMSKRTSGVEGLQNRRTHELGVLNDRYAFHNAMYVDTITVRSEMGNSSSVATIRKPGVETSVSAGQWFSYQPISTQDYSPELVNVLVEQNQRVLGNLVSTPTAFNLEEVASKSWMYNRTVWDYDMRKSIQRAGTTLLLETIQTNETSGYMFLNALWDFVGSTPQAKIQQPVKDPTPPRDQTDELSHEQKLAAAIKALQDKQRAEEEAARVAQAARDQAAAAAQTKKEAEDRKVNEKMLMAANDQAWNSTFISGARDATSWLGGRVAAAYRDYKLTRREKTILDTLSKDVLGSRQRHEIILDQLVAISAVGHINVPLRDIDFKEQGIRRFAVATHLTSLESVMLYVDRKFLHHVSPFARLFCTFVSQAVTLHLAGNLRTEVFIMTALDFAGSVILERGVVSTVAVLLLTGRIYPWVLSTGWVNSLAATLFVCPLTSEPTTIMFWCTNLLHLILKALSWGIGLDARMIAAVSSISSKLGAIMGWAIETNASASSIGSALASLQVPDVTKDVLIWNPGTPAPPLAGSPVTLASTTAFVKQQQQSLPLPPMTAARSPSVPTPQPLPQLPTTSRSAAVEALGAAATPLTAVRTPANQVASEETEYIFAF